MGGAQVLRVELFELPIGSIVVPFCGLYLGYIKS